MTVRTCVLVSLCFGLILASGPAIASSASKESPSSVDRQLKILGTLGGKAALEPSARAGFVVGLAQHDHHDESDGPILDVFIGLDADDVAEILGMPHEERQQPPAMIWIYQGQNCELAIYFFPRVEGTGYSALNYEVRDGSLETTSNPEKAQACLGMIFHDRKSNEHS